MISDLGSTATFHVMSQLGKTVKLLWTKYRSVNIYSLTQIDRKPFIYLPTALYIVVLILRKGIVHLFEAIRKQMASTVEYTAPYTYPQV